MHGFPASPFLGDEGLFFDRNNLTVLCETCHARMTSAEAKEAINSMEQPKSQQIEGNEEYVSPEKLKELNSKLAKLLESKKISKNGAAK